MAQKVSVLLTCDLHDEQDVEAAETAVFGLDGAAYEIELCPDHGQQLRDAVGPFAAAGRRSGTRSRTSSHGTRHRAGGGTRTAGERAGARPSGAQRSAGGQLSAVRAWARANGYPVSDHGRLSSKVTAAYEAAQLAAPGESPPAGPPLRPS